MQQAAILIVDDDRNLRKTLADILEAKGYAVLAAEDGAAGLALLAENTVDLALIDLGLPDISGLDLLSRIKAEYPVTAVIILTGNATLESAMAAANHGAFSYLIKPCEIDQLSLQVKRAIEKQRADTALRESEARFRGLLESAPDGILIVNDRQEILMVNRQFEAMFGYDRAEVIGRHLEMFTPPRFLQSRESSFRNRRTTRVGQGREYYVLRKDGSEFPVEISRSSLKNPGRDPADSASVYIIRDIKERIRVQEEQKMLHARLLQAQKLESVGQLAAGIAHEINTPAQFIGTNIDFINQVFNESCRALAVLLKFFEAAKGGSVTEAQIKAIDELVADLDWDYLKEEIPRAIGQSQEGIRRITSIVRAMKEFSHPGGKQKANADLNRIIETTITVSRNEWKYVATVDTDFDPRLQAVPCLADEMGQVFLNLLINAAHAIEKKLGRNPVGEKGKITIRTMQHDDHVEIRIADTGDGIPREIQDKVFDPFFTTKEVGRGTGQGLAIAHDVISGKHNGTLVFETAPESGTTFIIRLPMSTI